MLKTNKKEILVNFKISVEDLKRLKAKAKKHTDGNISRWIRYATLELDPKPTDVAV